VIGNGVGRSPSARCTFDVPSGQSAVIGCNQTSNDDGISIMGEHCLHANGSYLVFRDFETQSFTYQGWTYLGRADSERGTSYVT
jgi:hypothetical protein